MEAQSPARFRAHRLAETEVLTVGIDPGLTGAVAFLPDGREPFVVDMPTVQHSKGGHVRRAVDPFALTRLLRTNTTGPDVIDAEVYVERVNAFPGQGVSSVFSLGMTFGAITGVVAALGLPLHYLEPRAWKQHYKLDKEKEMARALATRYYPSVDLSRKKDHNRAEALLIARYGREIGSLR